MGDLDVDITKAFYGFPIIILTSAIVMPIAGRYVYYYQPKLYQYLINLINSIA